MERRKGSFFLYAAMILLALILYRSFFAPPAAPPQAEGDQEQVEGELVEDELDADGNPIDENQDGQNADPETETQSGDDGIEDDASEESAEQGEQEGEQEASEMADEIAKDEPPTFYTIGALDAEGLYKNVVTLSSQGATPHRVELNARRRNGKLLYRDLEYRAAYIGSLELTDAESGAGAIINIVAPGTPASDAGLQIGDVINSVQGEPVGSTEQFLERLAKIKPNKDIQLGYVRGESSETANLKTSEAPLQVMSPISPELQLEGDQFKKSFQISLLLQKGGMKAAWPELDKTMRTGNWDAEVVGQDEVRFKRTLSSAQLKKFGIEGPIEVTKVFRAVRDDLADDGAALDKHHFLFDVEIKNLGSKPEEVSIQFVGPTGTTIEGWWYQNKIHGRSSALFYTAGAKDIIVGTVADSFSFWGSPEIISEYQKDNFTYVIDASSDIDNRSLKLAAVDTQYFTVAMLPISADDDQAFTCFSGHAIPSSKIEKTKKVQRTTDMTFVLYSEPILLPPNPNESDDNVYRQSFQIFAGPKESHILQDYGLDDCRTFGWFAVFSKPLIWLLQLFYSIIPNYGIAIILLTFLVRLGMMPISRKAAKNALMMQYLQPEMKKIAEKHKEDFQKRGEAQNALLKKYNCHPLGGCLLMFVQLPIFIGLYRGISVDIGLRDKALVPGLNWCSNLAGPDQLFYWKDWGLPFLFDETGWLGPYFNILPLFTIVLFLIQQKLFSPPATDDQQKMMQKMMTFMMLFMGILFFKVSSGLCIYFITSSIWGIMERQLIPKPSLPDHMKVKDAGDGDSSKASSDDAPKQSYDSNNQKLVDKRKQDRERRKKLKDRI